MERLPESQVKLDIVADEAEFAEAVEKAARKVAKDIAVPGFRKGKVPRHMIERMYGREIFLEEAGRLIMDDLYREAIVQEDLTPVGNPSVEITEVDPIAFTVTVPVYPTIDPGDYASVRAEPEEGGIDQSDVDEVLNRLQKQSSPWVDPSEERTPIEGDQISLDLAIFDGDEQFQEPIEDAQFIIGESQLFEGLKDAVVKLKPGESTSVDLSFAEDDEDAAEQLRGKTLRYDVTLKGIKQRDMLELNDEFAKTYAGEDTMDELLATIRKDLHQGKTRETRQRVLNNIIDQIGEGSTIEIPSIMIDEAVQEEIGRMRQRFQMQRTSLEAYLRSNKQTETELAEELRPTVEKNLRNSLALREIANREGIEVTDQEIEDEINEIVAGAANPEQMQKVYSADRYMRSVLRNEIFDERLSDHLIEIATEGKGAVLNGYELAEGESTGRGNFRGTRKKSAGKKAAAANKTADETKTGDEGKTSEAPAGSTSPLEGGACPDDFPIKGNAGSKIYHQAGQSSYENTDAEICFADTASAESAGFRASKSRGSVAEAGEAVAEAADAAE
jgi:trigger factor